MPNRTLVLVPVDGDREYQIDVIDEGGRHEARVEECVYEVTHDSPGSMRITSDGTGRGTVAWSVAAGDVRWAFVDGRVFELAEARPLERARSGGHHGSLTAPMPATVLRVLVQVGDAVARGDSLVILEAMKMELPVRATVAGTIRAIHCREGELVQPGLTLIEIDEGQ